MFFQLSLLALPALAAGAACPAPPPSPPAPSCGSIHPKWTLSDIDLSSYYTYTSPAASGPKLGTISFTFANNLVAYKTECTGQSVNPLGTFYGYEYFNCTTPSGEFGKTSFSFDSQSSVIAVNSTWTCPGGDVVYSTTGSGAADLDCKTSTYTNPDWQAGEIYSNTSTTCEPASLTIQL